MSGRLSVPGCGTGRYDPANDCRRNRAVFSSWLICHKILSKKLQKMEHITT
jgi:hypothetical protein